MIAAVLAPQGVIQRLKDAKALWVALSSVDDPLPARVIRWKF